VAQLWIVRRIKRYDNSTVKRNQDLLDHDGWHNTQSDCNSGVYCISSSRPDWVWLSDFRLCDWLVCCRLCNLAWRSVQTAAVYSVISGGVISDYLLELVGACCSFTRDVTPIIRLTLRWSQRRLPLEFMDGLSYTTIIEPAEPLASRRGSALDR
jgi:hypothetical protein